MVVPPFHTSKWPFLVGKPMGLLGKPTILGFTPTWNSPWWDPFPYRFPGTLAAKSSLTGHCQKMLRASSRGVPQRWVTNVESKPIGNLLEKPNTHSNLANFWLMGNFIYKASVEMVNIISHDTVDGSEIPNNHLGCKKKTVNNGINYHINWCRISAINSMLDRWGATTQLMSLPSTSTC